MQGALPAGVMYHLEKLKTAKVIGMSVSSKTGCWEVLK